MAENVTIPALDGKESEYDVFKNSKDSNGIDVSEYKYMFHKALDTSLMVDIIIGNKREKMYNFSGIVEVTRRLGWTMNQENKHAVRQL
eukprot:8784192-Ditylum_brightwellii.AAC.1